MTLYSMAVRSIGVVNNSIVSKKYRYQLCVITTNSYSLSVAGLY